jgi:hypothetical protein
VGGPDRVFGSGKRDAESVSSAKRELPPDDQRAYGVIRPGRADGTHPKAGGQRKAGRATGVRDPETEGDGEA